MFDLWWMYFSQSVTDWLSDWLSDRTDYRDAIASKNYIGHGKGRLVYYSKLYKE